MSKKTIRVLFKAYSGNEWIGAVYYVKNIAYQFLEFASNQDEIRYKVYIYLPKGGEEIFGFCKKYNNVKLLFDQDRPWAKGNGFINRNLRELEWIVRVYFRRIDWIYPGVAPKSIYRKKIINWIPDFQHIKYPDYFSDSEREFRNKYFGEMAMNHSKLVLSSKDSYDTYARLYPNCMQGVGVVNFVSAIFPNDYSLDPNIVLKKYGVSEKFYIISNQFYRHKNHLTVFKAIKKAKDKGYEIQLICTGMTQDTKDPHFFEEIEKYINEFSLEDNIKILGLIPRYDQLTLMNRAISVIQPSIFEGWGTCTEDAKTLGQNIILSDIPVHREQANQNTIFFQPNDVDELANILERGWNINEEIIDKNCYGITNAVNYGKQFAKLLLEKM